VGDRNAKIRFVGRLLVNQGFGSIILRWTAGKYVVRAEGGWNWTNVGL
jgi:hypothetical protein